MSLKMNTTEPSPYSASELLKRAAEILKDPTAWVKGDAALDNANRIVSPASKEACKFCLIGAIRKASVDIALESQLLQLTSQEDLEAQLESGPGYSVRVNAFNAVTEELRFGWPISCYNDLASTTHADVLNVLQRAIEKAVKNEKTLPRSS